MRIRILQLGIGSKGLFMGLDMAREMGLFDASGYHCVWEGEVPSQFTLDDIYAKFNDKAHEGYKGHSLSVSDIIEVMGGSDLYNDGSQFYVDNLGFQRVQIAWFGRGSKLQGAKFYVCKEGPRAA